MARLQMVHIVTPSGLKLVSAEVYHFLCIWRGDTSGYCIGHVPTGRGLIKSIRSREAAQELVAILRPDSTLFSFSEMPEGKKYEQLKTYVLSRIHSARTGELI